MSLQDQTRRSFCSLLLSPNPHTQKQKRTFYPHWKSIPEHSDPLMILSRCDVGTIYIFCRPPRNVLSGYVFRTCGFPPALAFCLWSLHPKGWAEVRRVGSQLPRQPWQGQMSAMSCTDPCGSSLARMWRSIPALGSPSLTRIWAGCSTRRGRHMDRFGLSWTMSAKVGPIWLKDHPGVWREICQAVAECNYDASMQSLARHIVGRLLLISIASPTVRRASSAILKRAVC